MAHSSALCGSHDSRTFDNINCIPNLERISIFSDRDHLLLSILYICIMSSAGTTISFSTARIIAAIKVNSSYWNACRGVAIRICARYLQRFSYVGGNDDCGILLVSLVFKDKKFDWRNHQSYYTRYLNYRFRIGELKRIVLLVLFINTLRRDSLIKPDEYMTASRPDRVVASLESHESENAESRVFSTTNRSFCSSFRYCTVRCFYCLGEVDYHHSMGTWRFRYFLIANLQS